MKISLRNTILSCLALLSMSSAASAQEYFGGDYSCNPCFPDIGRFSAGADWLYWKATEDGLNYGLLTTTTTPATGSLAVNERILKPRFEYDSGYRVYIGYELPCYDWEIGVIYTHAPNTRARSSALAASTLIPVVTQNITILDNSLFNFRGILPAAGDAVKSQWGLDFDYIDFDLAHTLCLSDYLRVRPHIGIRYLWAKQTFDMDFVGTSADSDVTGNVAFEGFLKNRTYGVGVEGGLWGDWEVGCGFSILGHVGGSILYGKHKIRGSHALVTTRGSATPITDLFSYRDVEYTSIPMLDYFIGLQYATCLCEIEFNLHVGWEQHVAFDMNRFTTTDGGDLSLQGLTLGGGFAF